MTKLTRRAAQVTCRGVLPDAEQAFRPMNAGGCAMARS